MPEENKKETLEEQITCKNCETEFIGKYCPECGQSVKDLNRPFHFVIYDFAGTVFSFDTRFFRSLMYLLTAPGNIAHDFVEGKRARYMAPFQMYVFVSFVFFLTLSIYTKSSLKPVYEEQVQIVQNRKDSIAPGNGLHVNSDGSLNIESFADFNSETLYLAKLKIDEWLKTETDLGEQETKILLRLSKLLSDPNMFFVAAFKYFSWGLFVVMPVFALLLMLFFGRKGYYYTAHLTMSLNLHTFLFLILLLGLLIQIIFHSLPGFLVLILFLIFSVYEFLGIKRMYAKRFLKTFFFTGLMNFIYFMLFLIVSAGIITVAFLNF